MKKATFAVLLTLGLVLTLALGFALRDFAGAHVVRPALFVAWLAQLVVNSVPGWLWWAWFVSIAVVIAWRSLRRPEREAAGPDRDASQVKGPVRLWADRLTLARHRGDYFRWYLARDLAEVSTALADSLTPGSPAYHEREDALRLARPDALAALNAPPEVAAYLRAGLAAPPARPIRRRAWLRRTGRPTPTPLGLAPEATVAFLEKQLEDRHDD